MCNSVIQTFSGLSCVLLTLNSLHPIWSCLKNHITTVEEMLNDAKLASMEKGFESLQMSGDLSAASLASQHSYGKDVTPLLYYSQNYLENNKL